jgi:hypothetical protein
VNESRQSLAIQTLAFFLIILAVVILLPGVPT